MEGCLFLRHFDRDPITFIVKLQVDKILGYESAAVIRREETGTKMFVIRFWMVLKSRMFCPI